MSQQSSWLCLFVCLFFAFLAESNLASHTNEYSTGGFEASPEMNEVREQEAYDKDLLSQCISFTMISAFRDLRGQDKRTRMLLYPHTLHLDSQVVNTLPCLFPFFAEPFERGRHWASSTDNLACIT